MRDGASHRLQHLEIDVVHAITLCVVAGVVRNACGTAVHLGLRVRLQAVGTREQATDTDAVLEKRDVVGATAESDLDERQARLREVGRERLLDLGGAGRDVLTRRRPSPSVTKRT